jgi:hypothetical protein
MKSYIGKFVALMLMGASPALGLTINVDFQPDINDQQTAGRTYSVDYSGTAAAPDLGTVWNALTPFNPSPRAAEGTFGYFDFVDGPATHSTIVDSLGAAVPGVSVTIGDTFGVFSSTEDSATDGDGNAGLDRVSVQAQALMRDYLIATGNENGSVTIAGLDPFQQVILYLYGEGDNQGGERETFFDANGVTGFTDEHAGMPHPVLVEGPDYTIPEDVFADASGSITIAYRPNAGGEAPFNGFQLTTVPEPSTLMLVGLAAMGVVAMRRKR